MSTATAIFSAPALRSPTYNKPPNEAYAPYLPLQAGLSHIRKHLEEEFFVPSSPLELGAHGGFGIGVSARNIQCQASQDSQVRRSVVFSRPGEILVEDNVSVQCKVFSMPQCWRTMPRSSAGL